MFTCHRHIRQLSKGIKVVERLEGDDWEEMVEEEEPCPVATTVGASADQLWDVDSVDAA